MRMFGHGQGWRSLEDPRRVLELIEELLACHREFQLKVDGGQTAPFTGEVKDLAPRQDCMTVKLLRPLPWDLASGARFQMTFTSQDGRFDAPTALKGRKEYLQYDFSLPHAYRPADRRAHVRYPFRPRENVQILARAGEHLGLLGMLMNLSVGGMGIRIDRILRLDNGLRVPIQPTLFDPGLFLSSIRIQNLPRLPLLELRGAVVRTEALEEGLLLGVAFSDMEPREREILMSCLAMRAEQRQGGDGGEASRTVHLQWPEPKPEPRVLPIQGGCQDLPDNPLDMLPPAIRAARRSTRVVLVMPPGSPRSDVWDCLYRNGFLRVESADVWQPELLMDPVVPLLVLLAMDLAIQEGEESLSFAKRLQSMLKGRPHTAVGVLSSDQDPALIWGMGPRLRFLPFSAPEEAWWVGAVEDLRLATHSS